MGADELREGNKAETDMMQGRHRSSVFRNIQGIPLLVSERE